MYETNDLSCSNGGNPSVAIAHAPGSVPDGSFYDHHVIGVNPSDDGLFEYVITDLIPGYVSLAHAHARFAKPLSPNLPLLILVISSKYIAVFITFQVFRGERMLLFLAHELWFHGTSSTIPNNFSGILRAGFSAQ